MSIFASPNSKQSQNFGQKILLLHGLEGSPSGSKAAYLNKNWGALCPPMRTEAIISLKSKKGNKDWSSIDKEEINEALKLVMSDALDAINYCSPDIIVGSSMGGAILMKLLLDGDIDPAAHGKVFLAPAIPELVRPAIDDLPLLPESVWILGEMDTDIDNRANINYCKICSGNLIFSPRDDHRLTKALTSGLIDSAILTTLEIKSMRLN